MTYSRKAVPSQFRQTIYTISIWSLTEVVETFIQSVQNGSDVRVGWLRGFQKSVQLDVTYIRENIYLDQAITYNVWTLALCYRDWEKHRHHGKKETSTRISFCQNCLKASDVYDIYSWQSVHRNLEIVS